MTMMLNAPVWLTSSHNAEPSPISRFKKTTPLPPGIFLYQNIEVILQSCILLKHWHKMAKSAIAQSHFSTKTIERDYCILDGAICTEHLKTLVTKQCFQNSEHMQICKNNKNMVQSCIQEQYWEENNPISWSMVQPWLQLDDQLIVTRAWTEAKSRKIFKTGIWMNFKAKLKLLFKTLTSKFTACLIHPFASAHSYSLYSFINITFHWFSSTVMMHNIHTM